MTRLLSVSVIHLLRRQAGSLSRGEEIPGEAIQVYSLIYSDRPDISGNYLPGRPGPGLDSFAYTSLDQILRVFCRRIKIPGTDPVKYFSNGFENTEKVDCYPRQTRYKGISVHPRSAGIHAKILCLVGEKMVLPLLEAVSRLWQKANSIN